MHDKFGMDKSSARPDYHTFLDEGCSRMLGGADSGGAAGLPEITRGDSFLVQRPDDAAVPSTALRLSSWTALRLVPAERYCSPRCPDAPELPPPL